MTKTFKQKNLYLKSIYNSEKKGKILRAGDLRRRKSGKEAREVKVEKVKIGKNGKGRY